MVLSGRLHSDIDDDDLHIDSLLLRSLVNPTGLQQTLQKALSRIGALEHGLVETQNRLHQIPEEYVRLGTFQEVVENTFADKLTTNRQRLVILEEKVRQTLENDKPLLEKCLADVITLRSAQGEIKVRLQKDEDEQADLASKAVQIRQQLDKGEENLKQMQSNVGAFQSRADATEADIQRIESGLIETVPDYASYASHDVQCSENDTDQGEQDDDCADPHDHRDPITSMTSMAKARSSRRGSYRSTCSFDAMCSIREQFVTPVQTAIDKQAEQISEIGSVMHAYREEFLCLIRKNQQDVVDARASLLHSIAEVEIQLNKSFKRVESESRRVESICFAGLSASKLEVDKKDEELREKVASKLEEFANHFKAIQEAIGDLEHALMHHAEEINSRSTVYDMVNVQDRLDVCATKQDLQEIKRLVDSLSDRLGSASLGSVKARALKMLAGSINSPDPTPMASTQSLEIDALNSSSSNLKKHVFTKANRFSCSLDTLETSLHEAYESGGDLDSGESCMLRKQLEGVAMGLVGLGHLVLKEPRLGTSRQQRIQREKDLLLQLQFLRQWISNRIVPSGWNQTMLATMSLSCQHSQEGEPMQSLRHQVNSVEKAGNSRHGLHSSDSARSAAFSADVAADSIAAARITLASGGSQRSARSSSTMTPRRVQRAILESPGAALARDDWGTRLLLSGAGATSGASISAATAGFASALDATNGTGLGSSAASRDFDETTSPLREASSTLPRLQGASVMN